MLEPIERNRTKQTVAGWLAGRAGLQVGLDGTSESPFTTLSKPSTDPLFLDRTDDIARPTHDISIGMRKKGFNLYMHAHFHHIHYSPLLLPPRLVFTSTYQATTQQYSESIILTPSAALPLVPGRRNAIGTTQALSLVIQQKTLTYIIYAPSQKILPAYLQPTARYALLAVTIHPPVC
jgi:hypothetical protein